MRCLYWLLLLLLWVYVLGPHAQGNVKSIGDVLLCWGNAGVQTFPGGSPSAHL